MFWKTLILFILTPTLVFLGLKSPEVEPDVQTENPEIVEIISTTTPEIVTEEKIEKKAEIIKTEPPKDTTVVIETDKPIQEQVIQIQEIIPDFEEINIFARNATVNILCSTEGSELSPISGTGVIVDPRGLILTNAHIGQYLLLKDFKKPNFVDCVIRTGSPAYPKYKVELVYISPDWVERNKTLLKQSEPKGTGERDFAFLRITGKIDGSPITDLPYIPMNIREFVEKDEPVLLSSYPAGFLGGISILQDLNRTTAIVGVADVFTFGDNKIDLILIPGTVVSQKGSSGGAVVDKHKTLLGIISTSSDGEKTSDRNLYAITSAYINRSLEKELDINIVQFLNSDLAEFARIFNETTGPTLTKIIVDEITKQ